MKNGFKQFAILFLAVFIGLNPLIGQVKKDTIRSFKNTVRVNLTNPMLFGGRFNVLGYERVIKKNQSFSVNIGRFSLPKFIKVNTDSLTLHSGYKDKGFTISTDYRFYLKNENKYGAPRGVYLGPYYSYNYFERENTWSINTVNMYGELKTNLRLNANLVGAQLGYQFVIKNRVTFDMILCGPGIWFYSVRTTINTTLDPGDEVLIFEKINEILAEKLPGRDIFIQPGEKFRSGSFSTSSAGFRYMFQIGFRF